MKEARIDKATVADVDVIHQLLSELEESLGATSKIRRTPADLRRFGFSESPLFDALIAWSDGEAVGLVVYFREFSTWLGKPGVYVQDLYVSPAWRGAGLGSMLMRAVYERVRGWPAAYCKLMVHADNEAAMAFYRKMGFKIVAGQHVLIHELSSPGRPVRSG